MSLLELRDIVAGYADHEVLHGVSLAADPGSVTAILGPNGVGKTTLLNVALGWIRPTSGRVSLDGRELVSLSGSERGQQLSLVPQSDHIPFDYSILEYVLLGRAPYIGPLQTPGVDDVQRARDALDRVGLGRVSARGVLETSAGERQLVLLARSLAQDPAVLLLDEPSAHLDLANKRRLVELLRREAERGCCIVLTAHEPEFAAAVADSVTLLRDGSVLASGPPERVMTTELLTTTYGVPITVHPIADRSAFLW